MGLRSHKFLRCATWARTWQFNAACVLGTVQASMFNRTGRTVYIYHLGLNCCYLIFVCKFILVLTIKIISLSLFSEEIIYYYYYLSVFAWLFYLIHLLIYWSTLHYVVVMDNTYNIAYITLC